MRVKRQQRECEMVEKVVKSGENEATIRGQVPRTTSTARRRHVAKR